jgi:RNA polymerase sigma-70 factor (ECF subfamily)
MEKISDSDLVDRLRRGDRTAFEEIYWRYRDWVASLAMRFCGQSEDALDVLQDTFAYLWRKGPELELRSQFKTFLYPVVKHLSMNRGRRRHVPLGEVEPERRAEQGEELAEDLLAGLPEDQKEIVWMRFVDGFDLQGIADLLQIPLGTVKSRLHAALSFLRTAHRGTSF